MKEQIIGDPLDGIVIPEGIYPAQGRRVRVLVANNGTEGKFLQAGQKLEGLAVSENRGAIQVPAHRPKPTATQSDQLEEDSPKVNEIKEPPGQEFYQLLEDLEIPENKLLQAHPQIRKDLQALLFEYQDIFSQSTPGCTDQVELDLEFKSGTQPISQRFRDLNPELEQKLQDQIQTWLEEGVIEASKSPWSSPLVPVKKKDGSVR